MVQSARLGAWESRLEALAASVSSHTAAMQHDGAAHVDKKEVTTYIHKLTLCSLGDLWIGKNFLNKRQAFILSTFLLASIPQKMSKHKQ